MQKKSFLVVLVFIILVVAAFFLKSQPDSASVVVAQYREKMMDKPPEPVIQVNVFESRKFPADDFALRLFFIVKHENRDSLLAKVGMLQSQLIETVKMLNIPEKNIRKTSAQWDDAEILSAKGKRKSFVLCQNFEVHVESGAAVAVLEKTLLELPDVGIRGMVANLKNAELQKKEVVRAACEKALAKALEHAQNVNEKLGAVSKVRGIVRVVERNRDSVDVEVELDLQMNTYSENFSKKSATIEVRGFEAENVLADEFEIDMELALDGKSAGQAYELKEFRRNALFEMFQQMNISVSEIAQAVGTLSKDAYDEREQNPYKVSQRFSVKVDSKKMASLLVNALTSEKNVKVIDVKSNMKKRDSVESVLLKKATGEAMNEARMFADALGGKLGKVAYVGNGGNYEKRLHERHLRNIFLNADEKYDESLIKDRINFSKEMTIADSVPVQSHVKLIVEMK